MNPNAPTRDEAGLAWDKKDDNNGRQAGSGLPAQCSLPANNYKASTVP